VNVYRASDADVDVDVAPSTSISTSQLAQFSSPVQFLPFFPLYRLALYLNRLESCPSSAPGGIPRAKLPLRRLPTFLPQSADSDSDSPIPLPQTHPNGCLCRLGCLSSWVLREISCSVIIIGAIKMMLRSGSQSLC